MKTLKTCFSIAMVTFMLSLFASNGFAGSKLPGSIVKAGDGNCWGGRRDWL